jgi:hypothetical protein
MFPQVAPKFFGTRDAGPKNLGRAPEAATSAGTHPPVPAPARPRPRRPEPLRSTIVYDVTHNVGRTESRVTVTPGPEFKGNTPTMSMQDKIADLHRRREAAQAGGGADKLAKHRLGPAS